jgi:hypothetical protein
MAARRVIHNADRGARGALWARACSVHNRVNALRSESGMAPKTTRRNQPYRQFVSGHGIAGELCRWVQTHRHSQAASEIHG